MPKIEEFAALVPDSLLDVSGKVFYSGRDTFGSPSKLYILGLNPGGAPENYTQETVGSHTDKVLKDKPDNWSELTDQRWGRGKNTTHYREGEHPMQKALLHLLESVGLYHRKVPHSNLIFARSRNKEELEIPRLTKLCWPFHREVIQQLGVRVIVCLGEDAALGTKARLEADSPASDKFDEVHRCMPSKGQRMFSYVYCNGGKLTIVRLPHPSRFHYLSPKNDPSPSVRSVQRALQWSETNAS